MAFFTARRGRIAPWRTQSGQLIGLAALTIALAIIGLLWPTWMPLAAFSVVITLGGFFLRVRTLLVLYFLVAAVMLFVSENRYYSPTPGNFFVVIFTGVLAMAFALSRRDLGLQGRASDSMLLDLRDRLLAQGAIPPLPTPWSIEAEFSPADWQRFSGDFMVATRTDDDHMELALVDVSGKGPAAGTRALSLSGAFSGLLGAMPAWEFFPAANAYLLRQDWGEGFATAIHIHLNFTSGYYSVYRAGHPPAVHYRSNTNTWQLLDNTSGPALGIIDAVDFPPSHGVLAPGDALVLYTDGLVEIPGEDVSDGIQRLIHLADNDPAAQHGGAAARLLTNMDAAEDDDRSIIVIWRERSTTHPNQPDPTPTTDPPPQHPPPLPDEYHPPTPPPTRRSLRRRAADNQPKD